MSAKRTTGAKKAPAAKKPAATTTKSGAPRKTAAAKVAKVADETSTPKAQTAATVEDSVKDSARETTKQAALAQSEITPPAKAAAISPAIKSSAEVAVKQDSSVAVKETSEVAVKQESAVVVKEDAPVPAVKEKAGVPAVKEKAKVSTEKKKTTFTPINLGPNPYLPHVATVIEVIKETHNIMTFRVVIDDEEARKNFVHFAGQVGQLSLFGAGESTFVINSPPSQKDHLQFSVMRTGEVTEALHKLSVGDKVGVRGPLGNCFPREEWKGKDIFFIGGGIGMAPIRTIMLDILDHKADYGKVSLLYGARSPQDMAFSYELDGWMNDKNLDCHLTIDNPSDGWAHKVGLIPHVLTDISPDPSKTVAVLCGPPIMIKFTVEALLKLNFAPENIITTLEKRMKCGIGICGRCNLGSGYVCVDGPVYSWAQLKELPPEL